MSISVVVPACDDPLELQRALLDPRRFDALLSARTAHAAEHPSRPLRAWIVYGTFLLSSHGGVGPITMDIPPDVDLIETTDYFRQFPKGGYVSFFAEIPTAVLRCPRCTCGFDVRDYGRVVKDPTAEARVLFHAACWKNEAILRMKVRVQSLLETAGIEVVGLYLAQNEYDPEGKVSDGLPWMRIALSTGTLLLGFRRQVWSLNYTGLGLNRDLFRDANSTHHAGVVHLHDTGSLLEALKTIRAALLARNTP